MKYLIVYMLIVLSCLSCNNLNIQSEIDRGVKQYNADSIDESIKTLTQVINITDTCSECYKIRSFAFKDNEEYDKALKDVNEYILLNKSDAAGYANRASIFYMKGNYLMALEGFQKALELSPQSTDMYNPISHMLFATGRKEEACIYYYKSKALGDTTFDLNLRNHCEFE